MVSTTLGARRGMSCSLLRLDTWGVEALHFGACTVIRMNSTCNSIQRTIALSLV
jgi:hypothetical protein